MAHPTSAGPHSRKPLRLWPGLVFAALILLARYVLPLFSPGALRYGLLGAFLGVLAIFLWWLIFSRAAWWERLGAVAAAVAAMAVTPRFLDASIAKGNLGYQFFLHGIPVLSVALVVGAVAGERFFTQEQRGDDEIVTCYEVSSGEPVWRHRDAARFTDPHVGAGPRATPALGDGRVFRLRRQPPRLHRPRQRRAPLEGRALRRGRDSPARRPGRALGAFRERRAGARRREGGSLHRARPVPGDRGQDLEPAGPRGRRPPGA